MAQRLEPATPVRRPRRPRTDRRLNQSRRRYGDPENSHSWPPNTARPRLCAGLTDAFEMGIAIRWMAVNVRPIARQAKPPGARRFATPEHRKGRSQQFDQNHEEQAGLQHGMGSQFRSRQKVGRALPMMLNTPHPTGALRYWATTAPRALLLLPRPPALRRSGTAGLNALEIWANADGVDRFTRQPSGRADHGRPAPERGERAKKSRTQGPTTSAGTCR